MKENLKYALIIIVALVFCAIMWGLFVLGIGGTFKEGFVSFIILIGVTILGTVVVWVVTRLPVFPPIEFLDCTKYAIIMVIGTYVVYYAINAIFPRIPEWIGGAIGALFSLWACAVTYLKEVEKK